MGCKVSSRELDYTNPECVKWHQEKIKAFLERHRVKTLNVAGPRASSEPGITEYVSRVLERLFAA